MRRAHLGMLAALAALSGGPDVELVRAADKAPSEPQPTAPDKKIKPHIGAKQIAKALKRSSHPATRSGGE